uniref:Uncharacterized protein n=1 Tax=Arundo donax TaxID=35708 RepID=A0A0A9AGG0_ARUDO
MPMGLFFFSDISGECLVLRRGKSLYPAHP